MLLVSRSAADCHRFSRPPCPTSLGTLTISRLGHSTAGGQGRGARTRAAARGRSGIPAELPRPGRRLSSVFATPLPYQRRHFVDFLGSACPPHRWRVGRGARARAAARAGQASPLNFPGRRLSPVFATPLPRRALCPNTLSFFLGSATAEGRSAHGQSLPR